MALAAGRIGAQEKKAIGVMRTTSKRDPACLAEVDGWPITLANGSEAIDAVMAAARDGEGFSLVTLNVDHLVKLRRDDRFRKAYRAARFVTADGEPVARLARAHAPRIQRTTGADLVIPLARAAAAHEIPVFLFGSSDEVLAKSARHLQGVTAGAIDIAGSLSPGSGFDPEGPEADAALDVITRSGAKLCFLALGAPKQEIFAARALEKGSDIGFVSVGAALDFLAGAQIRAPEFFQKHGLEWSWRLATQPVRLAPRYLSCAWILADIVVRGAHSKPDWPAGEATR